MNNISVIIPIHEYSETVEKYLDMAITSTQEQKNVESYPNEILIVHSIGIEKELNKYCKNLITKSKIRLIKNDGKTDFQSQVNLGVQFADNKYFTILEYDDEVGTTFFERMGDHIETKKDVDIFLSTIVETNEASQGLGLKNQTVWSKQFVGDNGTMGYLNSTSLQEFTDFKICGAVINRDEFLNQGGLKSNIELTFNFEFLMRMLNNGCNIFTVPKIGYKHVLTRPGSLFDTYAKSMNLVERDFWFKVANKEYNFINDRIIDKSELSE